MTGQTEYFWKMDTCELELVDAQITRRLVEFYQALVERGQIVRSSVHAAEGVTVDYMADQGRSVNRSQPPTE